MPVSSSSAVLYTTLRVQRHDEMLSRQAEKKKVKFPTGGRYNKLYKQTTLHENATIKIVMHGIEVYTMQGMFQHVLTSHSCFLGAHYLRPYW